MKDRKKQKDWYSGKKKRHTMKIQLCVHAITHMIMCVVTGKGATHDLTLFRASNVKIHRETALIGDAGYQGIWRDHGHSLTPYKTSKNHPLTKEEKYENRVLANFRQPVEHMIRILKIFRILKDVYRHRRRRFTLRAHLIAAICNRTLECVA